MAAWQDTTRGREIIERTWTQTNAVASGQTVDEEKLC